MTRRVEQPKWILYRHTKSLDIIKAVATLLKFGGQAGISEDEKAKLLEDLAKKGLYRERNPSKPLDAINHRINTLAYYMFGYKDEIGGEKKFLFSPLGNLFMQKIDDPGSTAKIFLTMLWAIQFPHQHGGNKDTFNLFPFRLIFQLLNEDRIQKTLYAFEFAYLVVFVKEVTPESYEKLVQNIVSLRRESDEQITKRMSENPHAFVNAVHEWDYYVSVLLEDAGILTKTNGTVICRIQHGITNTFRKVTRNFVQINPNLVSYSKKLLEEYSCFDTPLNLEDPERLTIDTVKEIYSFYPEVLLREIGEQNEAISSILSLSKLIETYSNNNEGAEAYLFEDVLTEGFNMFYNVVAKKIGGAGKTDIECLYTTKSTKFSVDAKSTKNKLSSINSGRLRLHREQVGGKYTIVVTSRYVPAVKDDIRGTDIVIILASTFSEYLYNNITNNVREIDFKDFDDLILSNLGKDISPLISNLTFNKFAINE